MTGQWSSQLKLLTESGLSFEDGDHSYTTMVTVTLRARPAPSRLHPPSAAAMAPCTGARKCRPLQAPPAAAARGSGEGKGLPAAALAPPPAALPPRPVRAQADEDGGRAGLAYRKRRRKDPTSQ